MAKQVLTGKVISNKMQKTVVVEIERRIAHPVYKKRIKVTNKIKADSGEMQLEEGDIVVIESTRPLSKTKNFKVTSKVEEKRNDKPVKKTSKEKNEKKTKSAASGRKKGGRKASSK